MTMDGQSSGFDREQASGSEVPEGSDTVGPPSANPLNTVVTVPAGLTLQSLEVSGRNLIITLSDGSEIFVPDGAVYVPQIIVEGASVPPFNIAQLLTGNEPEPAAGPAPSSGGNFADDEGDIQAAFDLGDLLPFTDFGFPEQREEEIIPALDEEPEIIIETPDNPAGVQNAIATVDEEGLPERGSGEAGEPEGTNEPSTAETTSGTIIFSVPDGLSAILINGVAVSSVGQTFASPVGTLEITSINLATGEIGFTYTLTDNTLGEDRDGFFVATVIDRDGDQANATLTIIIVDDSPIAVDDIGIVPAGSHAAITGDVLANDAPGADDYDLDGAVTGFRNASGNASAGGSLQGQYGVLTINPDGSYTYVRDLNTPGGVEESFDYTIIDQDGSTSTATLTIRIGNAPNEITLVPEIGDGTVVNESALPPRTGEPVGTSEGADGLPNNDSDPTENTGATITFNSPDGVESVTLNGVTITPGNLPQTIISDGTGTFIVTGFTYDPVTGNGTITYEYTLGDNTSGDNTSVAVNIVVTDLDGDTAQDTLTINIVDDEPEADDDSAGQVNENDPVTIDVLANDTVGADDVDPSTVALVDGTLSGGGTLVNNGDGTFTYTPAPGEEGTVTFDYSITDGDGDVSVATATLELAPDSEPSGSETVATVDDDGLVGGNPASSLGDIDANIGDAPSDTSEKSFTGTLPFDVFNDAPASIAFDPALQGATALVGAETVTFSIAGNVLTATITSGARDGVALFTVQLNDAATGSYTVTLLDNVLHSNGSDENSAFASIDFVVTDSDGDSALTNLGIVFNDDAPSASDDAGALAAGTYGPVGGNVLTNDATGADGAAVTSYAGAQGTGGAGVAIQGSYGKLTIAADGTYSYTRDPGTPGGVTDTFSYTITDADGDTATAALVITIGDGGTSLDLPVAGQAGTIVDEAGLDGPPAGSEAGSDSETTTGTFTFAAQDGPATVLIDGTPVTSVGQTFTGTFGTLEITAISNGSISYSYTLTTNTSGDNTSDSFVVRVEDQDDDFSESTLKIAIVDDVPTANPDSDSVTEDGPLVADGNVLTGSGGTDANTIDGAADIGGADGASVTAVAFGANTGTVGSALAGAYGTLTLNADGSYAYQLDNQNGFVQGLDSTETLTEVFAYTITDGDGDTSTTTLTITINGQDDGVIIRGLDNEGAEVIVDEDDLSDGSSPDAAALTQSGSFTVDSPDGLASLTVDGIQVFGSSVTYPVTIDDPVYGLLTITGVTPVLDGNNQVISATFDYTYVLQDNSLLHSGADGFSFTDSFEVIATDTDGSTDTASLDVTVIDDSPSANADTDSVTEDGPLTADGNVLNGVGGTDANASDGVADIAGADAATVTGIAFGATDGAVGTALPGAYGSLTLNADGSYAYTLDNTNPLVQGLDGTENLTEIFAYTVTDGDGDTSTTTLTVTINGVDDPVVIGGLDLDPAELTVDEDDLADGSSPDAAALTQTGSFTITSQDGLAEIKAGGISVWTDAGGFVAGQTITTAIGTFVITGVTPTTTDANGDVTASIVNFSYTLNDNTLTHTQDGQDTILESFGIEAIDTDGSSDTGSVDVLVIDDVPDVTASGQSAPQLVTDDTDIVGGAVATASFAGLFTTNFGADGAAAADATVFSLAIKGGDGADSSLNDTLTGENILLRLNGDTIEGYLETSGDIAFTLALNPATGAITQTQLRAIEHDNAADPAETFASGEAEAMAADLISLTATVTDGDGDTDFETIEIGGAFAFEDDGPTATDNAKTVDEGAIIGGNLLTDDDGAGVDAPGADGYGSGAVTAIESVTFGGSTSTVDGSGNLVIATALGTLTVNAATGAYVYESASNSTNTDAVDVFTYTIVDGDGDETTATLTIDVTNAPGEVSDNDVLVNEAGLAAGSDPLATSEIDTDGQITVVGATGTLVYSLIGGIAGPGANEVQIDGTYGTIVLNTQTGAYTYTLDTPFTDTANENGPNLVNPAESFTYEVRDTNGNLIGTNAIVVSIIDDVPTATDQANVNVAEDAVGTISGNVLTDGTPDTEGADGATVTVIIIDGNPTAVPQDGSDATVVTAKGTYTIDMDGNWTFDPNPNQNHSAGNISAGFTYTLTDGDGDFDTAVQPITITDGANPSAGPNISLDLDDQNLADGSTPAGPDSDSDTIIFTEGSDDIVSIVFGDTSGLGAGLTWTRVSDTQITGSDGARLVVTLNLSVNLSTNTATVTATLNDNYDDHPTINVDDLVDLGDVNVIATDLDGDTATSVVSVSVSDDLPTISASAPAANALTVDETDLATNATADFSTLFTSDANADGPGNVGGYTLGINPGATGLVDTATNQAVVLTMNGGVVEGRTAVSNQLVFTVSVNSTTGVVTLDQLRAVKHGNTSDDNDPETLDAANLITLSATITDSDGDTDTATANIAGAITFLDDGPALSNVLLGSSVSVDESNGLTTSATSAASILSYVADYGEDGDNGATFAITVTNASSGLATADGDFPITLVQTSATLITGVFNNGSGNQTAFTVQINPNGTITLTQMVALEHLVDGDNSAGEHNDTLNLAGKISATVTITDGDGDTDAATVPIGAALTFFDDGPSVTLSAVNDSLSVSDANYGADDSENFADNFTFDGGEDGTASTSFALSAVDGSVSGLVDTATGNGVFLFLEGGVVIGREGTDALDAATGQEVFRVTVDSLGNVTLNQSRAVDHALSTGSTGTSVSLASDGLIKLIGTVSDKDGDTASQALDIGSNLTFTDDTPTAEPTLVAYLDDDALGGNANGPDDQSPDTQNLTGTLVDPTEGFGNDGGSVAFNMASILPSGFRLVDDPASDGVLIQQEQGTGNWVTVVTVSLNGATGAYNVSQNANILHPDDGANDENEVTFTLGATLTDGDNDTATTSLTIVVDDDTPTSTTSSLIVTVDEDGLTNGIANNGTNDATGAATGSSGNVSGLFTSGADDPLTFAFDPTAVAVLPSLTSGGVAVSYSVSATSIVATAGGSPVFTFTLNPTTGAYIFSLQGPLDHADADDSENVTDIVINFGPLLTATDADGDTITLTGAFNVRIDDDSPRANPDTDSLTEDSTNTTGNVVLGTGTDSGAAGVDESGADGFASPIVKAISGFNGAGIVGGNTVGEWGTLVLNGDGSYTYTPNNAALQGLDTGESETDTFTYTIEDKDGDAVSTTLIITINGANDAPVANPDTNWTIEDAALPITGNVLQTVSHPGAPSGTFGDVADTDVDGEVLSVTTTGTFNGTYGILTLNSNGTYSYSLYTQAQNPTAYAAVQALGPNSTPLVDTFNYTASDGTATNGSTLKISIFGANDAPQVVGSVAVVSEEGLVGGLIDSVGTPSDTTNNIEATGQITITDVDSSTFVVTLGAPTTPGLTSGGLTINWQVSPDGKTLVGSTSAGTVLFAVIDNGGNWTVDLVRPIDHTNTAAEDIRSFIIPVSVNDGTTTTTIANGIAVTIEDDGPIAVAADASSGTNAANTVIIGDLDADNDIDNNFGADGGKVVFTAATIASLQAQGLTSGFAALSYSISPDGTVLTAVKSGTGETVFTLTLDPLSAQDQYVLNLVQEIDSTSDIDFNAGAYNFVGGNLSWTGFVPLVETLGGAPVDNDSRDLLLTPKVGGANAGSVNTTATIGGISGGASVGSGETFRVDFVIDLRGDPADTVGGQDYAALANRDHVFDKHYDANGATALFKSTSGSQVRITAFDDPDGNTVVGDGVIDPITGITIAYLGVAYGSLIIPTTTATIYNVNGQNFTVLLNADGSVSVDGVRGQSGSSLNGTVIGVFTADGFNSVEYAYQSGGTFQVGDFGATAITNDPVNFTVPISVTDNDGDIVSSGNIAITLNPAAPPVVLDLGGDGVDFVDMSAGVQFDYNGDGTPDATAWVGPDDGILALDANGDGIVNDASEFVFGGNGQTDLEAIAALYDDNGDGVLDLNDAAYARFGVWQDADQDGVSDAGEFRTLAEAGIDSINLISDSVSSPAAGGDVTIFGTSSFTWANGATGTVLDVAFATLPSNDNTATPQQSELTQQLANLRGNARTAEFATVAALASSMLLDADMLALPLDFADRHSEASPIFNGFGSGLSTFGLQVATFEASGIDVVSMFQNTAGSAPTEWVSILAGDDSFADPIGIQFLSTPQPNAMQAFDWLSADPVGGFQSAPIITTGMTADQAMEALLIMDAPAGKVAANDLTPVDAVLADIAAESLLDQVIDQFAGQSDSSQYLVTEAGAIQFGLLDQTVNPALEVSSAVHGFDQQIDDAALAAAQA